MKLLKFMEDLVYVHKKLYKVNDMARSFKSANFEMIVELEGVDILRTSNINSDSGHSSPYSVFTTSTANGDVQHPNNAMEFQYGVSSFFRMSTGTEYILKDLQRNETKIELPRYNDNEDEIHFTLSTITGCATPLVMAAILLTLDTRLATLYTFRMSDADIDEFIELLGEAKAWIISNTVTS